MATGDWFSPEEAKLARRREKRKLQKTNDKSQKLLEIEKEIVREVALGG